MERELGLEGELGEVGGGGEASVVERENMGLLGGFMELVLGLESEVMLESVASLMVETTSAPVEACPAPWP